MRVDRRTERERSYPVCPICGSIQIQQGRLSRFETLVRLASTKTVFCCRRCGWRGWQQWNQEDLERLNNYGLGGGKPDEALSGLDGTIASAPGRTADSPEATTMVAFDDFDLRAVAERPQVTKGGRRIRRKHKRSRTFRLRNRTQQQILEIVLAAMMAGALAVSILLIAMSNGCSAIGQN